MKKTLLLAAFLMMILAVAGPRLAQAEGGCDLSVQAAKLKAVQTDASMDELEEMNAEILARRDLLSAAIDCDQNEISVRVDALGRLPDSVKTLAAYREILKDLAKASRYYDDRKVYIQSLGVWDLKSAARSITAWRRETFIPLLTWADNLLLWSDNQQFLERALERLAQASRVAFSLKLVNQNEIDDLFKKAQSNFDTALAENDKAISYLNQGRAALGLVHIQTSLKALADTYQIFFELQAALQKIAE